MSSVAHDMLNVNINRRLPAERGVEQIVLRSGGKILVASYDMCNAHSVVVDHVCEVVGRHSVGLEQHLVVQVGILDRDIAVYLIVERGGTLVRDLLADNAGFARVVALLSLCGVEVAAGAAVSGGKTVRGILAAVLALGAEAVVSVAALDQLLRVFLEHTHTLALNIRTAGAADIRTLVPVQTAGLEGSVYYISCALNVAPLIRVLDTENELSMVLSRDEVSIQRGAQIAYMHVPSRAGRKSCPDFHFCIPFLPVSRRFVAAS